MHGKGTKPFIKYSLNRGVIKVIRNGFFFRNFGFIFRILFLNFSHSPVQSRSAVDLLDLREDSNSKFHIQNLLRRQKIPLFPPF